MKNILFLITSCFPYDQGEEFLETEIIYLSQAFDEILIIPRHGKRITRALPANSLVIQYRYPKKHHLRKILFSLGYLFDMRFIEELKTILFDYRQKLSFRLVRQMLEFMLRGDHLKKFIFQKIQELAKSGEEINLYLYSYWMNYDAFAIANLHGDKIDNAIIEYCFCRVHGYDLYFERHKPNYLPFRKFIIEHLDAIFSISDFGKNYLVNKFGSEIGKRIFVSKIGVNNPYEKSKKSSDVILRIVSCSNLVAGKRIDLIIDTLSSINGIHIEWTHIGDGDLRDDLLNYAKNKFENNECIHYQFCGYLENKDVYRFYSENKVDLFINLSESEGLPVTMMEAMSFSIPVIGTNVGGVSEIVNNKNGILLSSNPSCEEIRNSITAFYLLSDQEKEQFRENAYTTWQTSYNAQKNYIEFINLVINRK